MDLVGAGGATNIISQGDSSVEVIDAGTGQVDVTLDSTADFRFLQASFAPLATGKDLGNNTNPWAEIFSQNFRVQTGGTIVVNQNNIVADATGIIINVPDGDAIRHSINGSTNITFGEDEIEFRAGRAHRISATNTSLQLLSELVTDTVQIWPGTARTNEAFLVGDASSVFKSAAAGAAYNLLVRYSNPTTTGQPAIGNIGTEAEDSANEFSAYAGIVTAIEDDTSTSRDGRMQFVVADGNTAAQRGLGQLTGVGLDIRGNNGSVQIAAFGGTPVAKPTVTGSRGGNAALASFLTALANLGWITDSTTA